MTGIYPCVLWRDPAGWRWLRSPARVEEFDTALDPDDHRSLEAALQLAAFRDRGDRAPLVLYELLVYDPETGELIRRYRHTTWPEDAWVDDADGDY